MGRTNAASGPVRRGSSTSSQRTLAAPSSTTRCMAHSFASRLAGSVGGVTAAAVLPVAADSGLRAGKGTLVEEVLADALHRGGFAGHPDAGPRIDVRVAHCGEERV